MKSPVSKDATIMGMKSNFRPHLVKGGIVFGLTLFYSIGFLFLMPIFGPSVTILSGFPVAAAGWYFGLTGGITAGIIAAILNFFLMTIFGGIPWNAFDQSGFFLGSFTLLVVGGSFGQMKRSFDTRARTETQLRAHDRYRTLLKMTTTDILSTKDLGDKYYSLITHLVNLYIADDGYFVHWDRNHDENQAARITSTTQSEQSITDTEHASIVSSIAASALRTKRIVAINDVSNSQYVVNSVLSKKLSFQAKSVLGIPFIENGYKLGAVVLAYDTPHQFTPEEIDQAQQVSDQIAIVLWVVHQEIEIQKRLRETNALVRIVRALSETERTGPNTVLHLIVESTRELIPHTEQAVIHLLDKEEDTLVSQAALGFTDDNQNWKQFKMQLGEGIAGKVMEEGITINVADVKNDPRFLSTPNEPSYRSLLVAPIQVKGKQIGTISVQSKDMNAFSEDEADLLKALGTQAAIAIENAHLLESTQQALNESNALYRVNQGLVTSLDPNELIKDTVELLQKNFDYHYVQIYVADPKSGDYIMRAGSGKIGAQLKAREHRIAAGEGIIGYTAETGTPFFTNNVDDIVSFTRNPLLPDTKSELAVPVRAGGVMLGLLDIHQVPPKFLSQRDIQLVSAVADQLAVALQKADLYETLQISLQQEKAIRNQLVQNERLTVMGRLLATVSHELNNPLQAIQNALFLLKDDTSFSVQGRQDLEIVLAESERMANMIERLRATYRPTQADDFVLTQINTVIEDVYALISTHLRHNQIAFEFHPDPELPSILALADQIRQVLLNLLMNAVESMTTGGKLTVSTTLLKDTHEILLTVSDTGNGITPDLLPNIFEAFVTDKQRGTGLGLTISYDIVMKHNGRITAENQPGAGALFKVWLPIHNGEIE